MKSLINRISSSVDFKLDSNFPKFGFKNFEKTLPEMIEFDENGDLLPYEIIEVSLADFEQTFVAGMPDKEQRSKIFATYLQYLSELLRLSERTFFSL